ncbi:CSLREA domain-containing protein [Dokdonella fugitiva]|uniref:CSLREA domain-containing protein n=1 Tax=Dokdonella fugitiva TaxID=328517 RepID=A0A839FCP7_9GAMM|nr:choice-of-anchor Q domain-containing protein [Dokdonella fugitiva]MBA8889844.1 CSLREA domain-containing protein [Dokdonella fugitiva]
MIQQRHLIHALAVALASGGACAATFAPDTTDDTVDAMPGDGFCADAGGHCSLRAAIQESNALAGEDTIVLDASTYALTRAGSDEDAAASGDLDVDDDLVLQGAGAEASIIDGGALDRVLDVRPAASARHVRVEGLTLRNGALGPGSQPPATKHGAGLRVGTGANVELAHVDVRDNHLTAFFGAAGIDNTGCLVGHHVRVIGNTDPAPIGSGSAFAGGIATDGADSCLVLEDSEISDNRADYGGALTVDGFAPVTLRRTLVANNAARFSGALHLNQGDVVRLENVTISGNAGDPGAILNDGGTRLVIVDSTITGNHASGSIANVGGIHDVHGGFGLTELTNTILSGNGPGWIADDCASARSIGGGNIIGDSTRCHFDAQPDDQLDVDPGLGALADNGGFTRTHRPGANAIDHGAAACSASDQRGVARPQDGDGDGGAACDAGAVEIGDADAIFANGFDGAATSPASPRGFTAASAARNGAADRVAQGT